MKVTGPGSGTPPEASSGASESAPTEEAGRAFAEKLTGTTTSAPATAKTGIAEIAEAMEAGALSSSQAIDQVVQRIVTQQLGPDAPAGIRKQLETTLRQALEEDPVLVQQVRQLG